MTLNNAEVSGEYIQTLKKNLEVNIHADCTALLVARKCVIIQSHEKNCSKIIIMDDCICESILDELGNVSVHLMELFILPM